MYQALGSVVLILSALLRGVLCQNCDKNSYLPKGLACSLNIFVRSEGQSDTNLSAPLGSSFLVVNGQDYSTKSRGINLAAFDFMTGRYMTGGVFDVKASAVQGTNLSDFIQTLPNSVIILMAVQGTGNANSNLNNAVASLKSIGVTDTAILDKESFGAVLYKGSGSQPWIKESKNSVGNGPSFVTKSIAIPYGYIPEESIRTPFFNVAGSKFGGYCIQSSSQTDTNSVCGKALDGLTTSEWISNSEGVGTWMTIGFASPYKINKVRILQRTLSGAQSKDVRIDFSDCSTFAVTLTQNKNDFQEFKFSPRITSWVKLTVTSTYTTSSNGFKEIQFYYDQYQSDTVCEQVSVISGSTSNAYRLLTSSAAFQVLSQKPIIILSTTSNASGPRYEIILDDPASNTTYVSRSHDGSAPKQVAVSVARKRVISGSTSVHVWLEWKAGRVIVGMGESVLLYYRDEQPLDVKYLFLQSPSSNAEFEVCARKDYIYESALSYWPLEKVLGGSLLDLNGSKQGTLHGPLETMEAAQAQVTGYNLVATKFDGTSNWADLGDFKDTCVSDMDLCYEGISVSVRVNRQGSGERYIISSGGQHTRGFAIYSLNSTTLRVEVRDSQKRWAVDKYVGSSGHLSIGFSWSKSLGLTVVSYAASVSVERNSVGEALNSPVDETSRLTLGRPNNQMAKYFQGSINTLAIFDYAMTSESLAALFKGTGLSDYTDSCHKDNAVSPSFLYYPGDINPDVLSPSICREHCGNAYYKKALMYEASVCTCTNVTSSLASVPSDFCTVPCTGNAGLKCGGQDSHVHVLDAIKSATSLVCTNPATQEALTSFSVAMQISKPFYDLEKNFLEVGDGSYNQKLSSPFKHVFVGVGNFTTRAKAALKNNETGDRLIFPCTSSITSFLPTKGFSFSCPSYVPTNTEFKCSMSFIQGNDVNAQVTWTTSGSAIVLSLPDSMVVSLGPEYAATSPAVNQTSPGMYVFSESVKDGGTFVGFQLDVAREGYLEVKCLGVVCDDSTQRFCPSQRACISQNSICQPQTISCASASTLSMSSGRCSQSNSNSPTVASSNFNYNTKSSYQFWVNSGQRNLIALNNTVDVSECNFFGLLIPPVASAASMATSYAFQSIMFYSTAAVIAAGSNNNTFVGLKSPQQANGPQVTDNVPNIQFKVIPQETVTLTYTYAAEGTYKAKADYGSNSATNLIHAQNVISNISVSPVAAYPTNEMANISLSLHSGTNVSYTWILNTTNATTSTPWVMHVFPTVGFHPVGVFGSNKVSVSYSRCTVECQERISGLDFTSDGLPTSAEKEPTRISWSLQNGSNVNFRINPGDGSRERELNDSKVAGALFVGTLNVTYAAAGVYNATITACNKIGCITISGLITIQEKIANVSMEAPNCMATNKSVNVTARTGHGNMMRYSWTINNKTIKTYEQPWLIYTPSKAGIYNFTLLVHNNVSTGLCSCKLIPTKDTLGNVEIGPVQPAGIGQLLSIPYKVNHGSDFSISVCFGDRMCVDKNGTQDAEGVAVYSGVFTHNYAKDGDYLVNLTVCNCVGCNSTSINVHVETPVSSPKVAVSKSGRLSNLENACSTPLYVLVNQTVFMGLTVGNGTNVKVVWDYGDGLNSSESSLGPFNKDGMHSNHSYTKAGNYTITAKPHNLNGHKVFTCHIVAQNPVLGLEVTSNSPVGFPHGSATVTTVTTDQRPSGPIHCVFVYGDTKTSASLPMSFTEKQTTIAHHKYPSKGKFKGSVNCSNAVSFHVKSFEVEVQDKVYGSTVKALGTVPQKKRPWTVGDGYRGKGNQGTIFGRNTDIQFITNSFNGSNLTCSFCFDCNGGEQVIKNSTCGIITHKFSLTGKKEVKVEVKNDVSFETIKIELTIDDNIDCANLVNDGPKAKGEHHIFTATPNMVGPNWCCYINYGDSSKPEFLVPKTSNCTSNLTFPTTLSRFQFKENEIRMNHTYPAVGEYIVTMECGNRVSECRLERKAVLVQIPCKQPVVKIMDFSLNKTSATERMGSVEIEIRSKNQVDCKASLKRLFTWVIKNIDKNIKLNMTGRIDTSKEHLVISPRSLEVGLYKICFTLNMTEIIGVHGTACCHLRVIPSPITAVIVGGTEVAVGFNRTRSLDARSSKDPDTAVTAAKDPKLKCYWFCRREGDNYTMPVSVDPKNLPPVPKPRERPVNGSGNLTDLGGCFGDGPGRLNNSRCLLEVSTAKMQENTTYDFTVCVVHEDGRTKCANQKWNIKEGDPPDMAIRCHFNCKEKLNPSSKVSLSCYCVSCAPYTSVSYDWQISRRKVGTRSEYETLSEDEVEKKITTPIHGRNFAIDPNALRGGEEYKFTCKGSRGNKGAKGSASYERVANSKPINGRCDVTPKIGEALNTTFMITCSGWKDEDQPLLYTYGSAHECGDEMKILAPDRGEPSYKVESMNPGPKENNYTTYVIVHVADKHKAVNTSTCIPIQVKEKKLDTKSLGNILNGTVQNLLASGSGNEVNQVVSSILSQVNQESSSSSSSDGGSTPGSGGEEAATKNPAQLEKERQERTQIRAQVISVMAQVANTATNLKDVTQTTNTLEKAVNDPKELTSKAKEQAVNVFSQMTSAIQSKSKNAEPQEVEQAVIAVYEGISNCVNFVADSPPEVETPAPTTAGVTKAQENDDDYAPTQKKISKEQKNMNRKLAATIVRSIKSIASLVQETKRAGENPTVLKTRTMEIELARERNEDLKNKSFSMPGLNLDTNPEMFPGEDLGGGKEPAAIDSMILTSSKNIYNFDESVGWVEGGKVATIEFKNSTTQDALVFQHLPTPIEMFIERVSSPYKPTVYTMTKDSLYFIRTRVYYNDSALHVHVYPDSCEYGFYVYIKRGSFPSESNFDYNYTLPHEGQWDLESDCSKISNHSTAFEIFLSNRDMNYTAAGRYYIGIKIKPRNMTNSLHILPANFTARIFTTVCMYWDTKNETWKSDGCVVGPRTTPLRMQCFCDHLTSFSTSFFVPPNKIDWNLVKKFDHARAAVCLYTVIVVLCLYLIFLIPARRADRRDAEKTGVSPLPDNDPRDTYCYEIHVHTGFMRGAGSSAEVSVVMNGSVGESDPRVLKDPARKTFRTGGVDAFLMTVPQSLGNVRNIRIWHNNGGGYPSWNLLRVMIQDLQTDKRWWFVCDKWLAVDEGDGKVERILYPATSNELTKFNVLFATEVRKNLTDGHLWFSVVTRPARSTFTRVQRLTCCLSILLCTMLANIMFYQADTSQGPKGSIKVAGFSFSLAQVSIGVMSSLIVFPANLIVVQLFRKARAKETKIKVAPKEGISPNEVDIEVGQEEEEKPKKEGLPHWFVYVAYFLALGSSLVSGSFVIAYGITYGQEKSLQWLTSMIISFVQDVLISQPIKVFLLASIFALLIKDPNKAESDPLTDANKLSTDEEWLHKNVQDLNEDEKDNFKKLITDRPPDEAKLEIARQLRMKEKHMKSIIRELVWYTFFLLIVLTVSYGNRDPATYHVTKYINDIFLHSRYSGKLQFGKVSKINDYWKWMNTTVLPSIYKDKWYNGLQSYPLGFIADTPTDLVLAVTRLRQLRIKKDSCSYLPIFHDIIHECNDFYSTDEEDRRSMLPGWKQPPSNMSNVVKKTAWDYQTGEDLKTFAYWGSKATYEAGGYVQELPSSFQVNGPNAEALLQSLQDNNWLDRYTRAIFTELSIYNANTNFFCVITLLYEQLPTGGLFNYPSILTLKLYRYVGGDMIFVLSCEIIYLLFTLYFIFRELKMVKKEGMGYLKNPWSMVEVFVTLLSMSLVVLYFVRIKFTSDSVKAMRMDHDKFVSFHYTAFLDEWINAMMGLIVFLSFLKIVRLLRFNRRMSLLAQTLKVCFPRIFAFLLIYGMAFFAYSQFACLVFGQSMEGFGTILRSAATLMDTILGKFALKEITEANRLIGPTFFYFYTVTMVFILINMFLSIINESFSEVKSDVNKQSNDYEIVNFMVHRLKENIGKTMGNAIMPIYKEPKSKLEKDCDTIEDHADSIMHYMRNMTFENMRHTRWFEAETSKERKKKMFRMLLEVDWDYFEDELADAIPVFEEFLNKYDDQKLEEAHRAYRFKKLREEEMESRFTVRESDEEEEEEDSSAGSNCDDSGGESDSNSGEDKPSIEYNLLDSSANPNQEKVIPSPAASVRSMYASPTGLKTPILLHSPRPKSPVRASPDLGKAQRLTPVPLANEFDMSEVLDDVERSRCATDAELNSFLPEVKSVDDNNIPKYESDPEQTSKKEKKQKKAKKVKPKSGVSLKSKAAWGDDTDQQVSRKSPAGSSDKGRVLPEGAENDNLNDFARDDKGFEGEIPSDSKEQKRRKKNKKKELKLTLTDDLDCESME